MKTIELTDEEVGTLNRLLTKSIQDNDSILKEGYMGIRGLSYDCAFIAKKIKQMILEKLK